jgi:hypothetical protein
MKKIFKYLDKFNVTINVLNNNEDAMVGFPETIAAKELFISNTSLIVNKVSILQKPKSVIFDVKTDMQNQLRDELRLAIDSGITVARRKKNIPLMQALKKNLAELGRTKIHELPEVASRVYDELKSNEEMALSTGYTAEKLEALKDLISTYKETYKSADYEFNTRKTVRAEMMKLISDNLLILKEELDTFVFNCKETFPAFYNEYTTSRARKKYTRKKAVTTKTSDISGTVTSSVDGAPVANALVSLKGNDTVYTTDEDGYYEIDEVVAGDCIINCFAPEFIASQAVKSTIAPGESLVIDFSLVPLASDGN